MYMKLSTHHCKKGKDKKITHTRRFNFNLSSYIGEGREGCCNYVLGEKSMRGSGREDQLKGREEGIGDGGRMEHCKGRKKQEWREELEIHGGKAGTENMENERMEDERNGGRKINAIKGGAKEE